MSKPSILSDFFDEITRLYPSMRAFLGDHSLDDKFENTYVRSHTIRSGKIVSKYAKKLETCPQNDIETKMLKWIVHDYRIAMRYPFDLLPLDSYENSVINFTFINKQMYPLKTIDDVKNLISRHVHFQHVIDSMITKMRIGIKKKVVLPTMICKKLIQSLKDFVKMKGYYIHLPRDVAFSGYDTFMHKRYKKSIQTLIRFLSQEYIKHCRETIGLYALPRGNAMYAYLIRSMTTVHDMTAEKAHQLGIDEMKRIREELEHVKVRLGYCKDIPLKEFQQHMLQDSKNYYTSKQAILKDYIQTSAKINRTIIPKYFHSNVQDHKIDTVPKSMQNTSPGAFYYPPSIIERSRPGVFYLNVRNVRENPKFSTMTLSLHEGKPGHHYQFQYMIEKNVPIHMMYSIDGTAFIEGWGLYAESLGDYKNNPYDHFGSLTYEMFRAVRLVVDTGIHHYGWSFDKAVKFMTENLAMSKTEIETEVERYICMPAQALCYKIGERTLRELREKWVNAFGDKNESIRCFHDAILESGVVPLDTLHSKIDVMINLNRSRK